MDINDTVYVETSASRALAGHVYLSAVFFKKPLLSYSPEFLESLQTENAGVFKYPPDYYKLVSQIKDEFITHTIQIPVHLLDGGIKTQVKERLDDLVSLVCLRAEKRTLRVLTSDYNVSESYYFQTHKIPPSLETRIVRSISYLHTKYSMLLYDTQYPQYRWKYNLGYKSYYHYRQIIRHGLSPYHRRNLNRNIARWLYYAGVTRRFKYLLPHTHFLVDDPPKWWKKYYPELEFNHCLTKEELKEARRVVNNYKKGKYSAKFQQFEDWVEENSPPAKLDLQFLKDLGIDIF